jgi:LysR family transcriptional regulator for bpeEF and oprC
MDRFRAMEAFVHVVETGSFLKAAHRLSLPRSSITMTIQKLERHLGVRLINRTTRTLRLTADGEAYYERCRAILADLDAAENGLREGYKGARGKLRVDMPASIGRSIMLPALARFRERFPEIELAIGMSDRLIDLVQEGVDCVIRTGVLADSTLIARRIGEFRWVVCGAPAYFEKFGEPQTPASLSEHVMVAYSSARNGRPDRWIFSDAGNPLAIDTRATLIVDETFALCDLALAGCGLVRLGEFNVAASIGRSELREVLRDYVPPPVAVSVVYPPSRHLSPAVRAFVDWAQATVGTALSSYGKPSQAA